MSKPNLNSLLLLIVGVFFTFSAFQCDGNKEDTDPLYCGIDEGHIEIIEVTVEQVACGIGIWDNLWFNDGSNIYLQPYSLDKSTETDIEKIEIKNQMALKIYFQYAEKDGRYADVIVCHNYPWRSNPIKIIDIEIIE